MFSIFLIFSFLSAYSGNMESNDPQQLVVVVVPNNDANQGHLTKFEKSEGEWIQVGQPHPITIGKNGIAWSMADYAPKDALSKMEGDKRSPAGIFPLSQTFGRASKDDAQYIQMPYEEIGPNAQCIEDRSSAYYNRIVFDNTQVKPDWDQDDRMLREDDLYDWGVFVEVNEDKTPGKGSCIFIHIWRGADKPTAGCTAMSKKNLTKLVYWLDASKNPQLVLMPKEDYQRLKDDLHLPALP